MLYSFSSSCHHSSSAPRLLLAHPPPPYSFLEPSNFAFLTLLLADGGKTLKMLCRPGPNREEKILTIICHLFCRSRLPTSTAVWAQTKKAETGPSVVILQNLSEIGDMVKDKDGRLMREGACVKDILIDRNFRALKALVAYTACFVEAYPELGPDNILPL